MIHRIRGWEEETHVIVVGIDNLVRSRQRLVSGASITYIVSSGESMSQLERSKANTST